MPRSTLRQLEYFVAAAEAGSVTAASEKVSLSQSAISTALAELEHNLGTQLFVRRTRGLILTPVGQDILRDCRQLLAKADELHRKARDLDGSFSGPLSIGCYSTLATFLLPKILDPYLRAHPFVDLNLMVGSHTDVQRNLHSGSCDVALLYDYEFDPELNKDDLNKTTVRSTPPHVIIPTEHELAEHEQISLAQLVDEPMILFDTPPAGKYFTSLFEARGLEPRIRFRATEFELVRSLVARGFGYSILTQHTDIDVSYENQPLAARPIADVQRGLNIVAVHLPGARLTRRAAAFIEQCEESLNEQPNQTQPPDTSPPYASH